jgi:hypothetical protein
MGTTQIGIDFSSVIAMGSPLFSAAPYENCNNFEVKFFTQLSKT